MKATEEDCMAKLEEVVGGVKETVAERSWMDSL